jgi:hypothetical protein
MNTLTEAAMPIAEEQAGNAGLATPTAAAEPPAESASPVPAQAGGETPAESPAGVTDESPPVTAGAAEPPLPPEQRVEHVALLEPVRHMEWFIARRGIGTPPPIQVRITGLACRMELHVESLLGCYPDRRTELVARPLQRRVRDRLRSGPTRQRLLQLSAEAEAVSDRRAVLRRDLELCEARQKVVTLEARPGFAAELVKLNAQADGLRAALDDAGREAAAVAPLVDEARARLKREIDMAAGEEASGVFGQLRDVRDALLNQFTELAGPMLTQLLVAEVSMRGTASSDLATGYVAGLLNELGRPDPAEIASTRRPSSRLRRRPLRRRRVNVPRRL